MTQEDIIPYFSLYRAAMLRRCPREYYLHYVYATPPEEDSAPPRARLAGARKRLITLNVLAARLCSDGLRDALAGEGAFPDTLWRAYRAEVNAQLLGESRAPCAELFFEELAPDAFTGRLKERLRRFAASSDAAGLAATPRETLLHLTSPATFELAGTRWLSTALCARRRGDVWEFHDLASEASRPHHALFHRYFAAGILHLPLARIVSVFHDEQGKTVVFDSAQLRVTELLDELFARAREGAELAALAGAEPEAVPGTGDCEHCRFRGLCRA